MTQDEIMKKIDSTADMKELEKLYYQLLKDNAFYPIPEQIERINVLAVEIKQFNQKNRSNHGRF